MEFDNRLEGDHVRETCPEAQLGLIVAFHIDEFGKPYSQDGITHLPTLDLNENRLFGIMSEVENYVDTNRSGDANFAKEQYFTYVVSDVRSELAMVSYFLEQQERILGELIKDCDQKIHWGPTTGTSSNSAE
jgi:hypothetical protein